MSCLMKRVGITLALLSAFLVSLSSCGISLRESDTKLTFPDYAKNSRSEDIYTPTDETVQVSDNASSAISEIEVTEPTDPYEGVDISFVAAGDNLIHPNIYIDAYSRGNEQKRYDFLPMYADVASIVAEADIAFINQETVMAGEAYGYSGYPCFNSPNQLGLDLITLGFDVVNIANNHMLDMGTQGLASTIEFWNDLDVLMLGGYLNEEDSKTLRTLECDGITIAFLSYTLSTNGIVKSSSSDIVIPYIDDELILSDIANAREKCDVLVVSMHWGDENTQSVNSEQYRLASLISNAGADVILGHHSHTLQPIEWIEREDGKRTLCIYSLGNFVEGMAYPVNQVGGFLSFSIRSDGNGGLAVEEPCFIPTVFYYGMDWYDTHLYLLEDYTEEIAKSHGVAISGYTLTPDSARKFVTNVISEEFLPDYMKNN